MPEALPVSPTPQQSTIQSFHTLYSSAIYCKALPGWTLFNQQIICQTCALNNDLHVIWLPPRTCIMRKKWWRKSKVKKFWHSEEGDISNLIATQEFMCIIWRHEKSMKSSLRTAALGPFGFPQLSPTLQVRRQPMNVFSDILLTQMQCCNLLNKESFHCQITQYICDCNGKRKKYIL